MKDKDQLIRRIEMLSDDALDEVFDFVTFIQERRQAGTEPFAAWGEWALRSGSFEFWNDPEEQEYSPVDLRAEA